MRFASEGDLNRLAPSGSGNLRESQVDVTKKAQRNRILVHPGRLTLERNDGGDLEDDFPFQLGDF